MAGKPVKITHFRLMIRDAGLFIAGSVLGSSAVIWGAKTCYESLEKGDMIGAVLGGGVYFFSSIIALCSTDKLLEADSAVRDYLKRYRKAFNGVLCRQ